VNCLPCDLIQWNETMCANQNRTGTSCMPCWDLSCSTGLWQPLILLNVNTVFTHSLKPRVRKTGKNTGRNKDSAGKAYFFWKVTPSRWQSHWMLMQDNSLILTFLEAHLWSQWNTTLPFFTTMVMVPKINSKTTSKLLRHWNIDKDITSMVITI